MRILALDIGDKRIGVALSDPQGILASPNTIIVHKDVQSDIDEIIKIAGQQNVERIIIGLPKSLSGNIGTQAEKVKAFSDLLQQSTSLPIELRDERLSTVSARRMVHESGTRKGKKKIEYDAIAAAIILQGYLDELANSRDKDI